MIDRKELNISIKQALREDAASHDITTRSLIPSSQISQGYIVARENTVLCGLDIVKQLFRTINSRLQFKTSLKDGRVIMKNTKIAKLKGLTRCLLSGERAALNYLGYLSGIATRTRQFVTKTKGTKAKIYDTRKTIPGHRALEKYAVRCGGGHNHRYDLSGHILIKDNHRVSCKKTIVESIRFVRRKTRKMLEIEVDNLIQLKQALSAKPDIVLLDNMSVKQIKKSVFMTKQLPAKKRPLLEASGGITIKNVRAVAQTGVDRISIGSLTHTLKASDFSLELIN